jgi:hypothetical protein
MACSSPGEPSWNFETHKDYRFKAAGWKLQIIGPASGCPKEKISESD